MTTKKLQRSAHRHVKDLPDDILDSIDRYCTQIVKSAQAHE